MIEAGDFRGNPVGQHSVSLDDGAGLVGCFVIAGRAAGFAVQQAIGAQTDVNYRLAQAAIFLAQTLCFRLLTLHAAIFGGSGSGAHKIKLAPWVRERNVT